MPYSHLNDFPADIRERAARIRLACFDVDGTLTDGRLYIDRDGNEMKAFHVLDGLGLKLLMRNGVAVAFVTARAVPPRRLRARRNSASNRTPASATSSRASPRSRSAWASASTKSPSWATTSPTCA